MDNDEPVQSPRNEVEVEDEEAYAELLEILIQIEQRMIRALPVQRERTARDQGKGLGT